MDPGLFRLENKHMSSSLQLCTALPGSAQGSLQQTEVFCTFGFWHIRPLFIGMTTGWRTPHHTQGTTPSDVINGLSLSCCTVSRYFHMLLPGVLLYPGVCHPARAWTFDAHNLSTAFSLLWCSKDNARLSGYGWTTVCLGPTKSDRAKISALCSPYQVTE